MRSAGLLLLILCSTTVVIISSLTTEEARRSTHHLFSCSNSHLVKSHYDVLVYSATPAGFAAAVAASELNRSVLLVETTNHLGGMATEGGIGLRDAPSYFMDNPHAVPQSQYRWGMRNAQKYGKIKHPIWQPDNWIGEESFMDILQEANVHLCLNTNFQEGPSGVRIDPGPPRRISALALEHPAATRTDNNNNNINSTARIAWISAKYFIDASYDGELVMAAGGVSFTVGRESSSQYNESLGGVTASSLSQFPVSVDPTTGNGEKKELLKYVSEGPDPRQHVGEADDKNLMAYSYRVCLTTNVSNSVPITPPKGYKASDFELARRLILAELAANQTPSEPWLNLDYMGYDLIPNQKSIKLDACCGSSPVGIDATGLAVGYATSSSRAVKAQIAAKHRYYVQGLMWFWQTDRTVPKAIRREHLKYGLCMDEWVDNGHFPRQLYIREAIRLVGDKVFTQNDRPLNNRTRLCRHDSIAIATWGFDIHDMQRVAVKKSSLFSSHTRKQKMMAFNEGLSDGWQGGNFAFELPYWIILPKRSELTNLAVPNCPSVSHVAFAAIREEPTLWQLGQAAGVAAAIGVEQQGTGKHVPLQDVNVKRIQAALLKQGTVIHWPPGSDCSSQTGADEESVKATAIF